MTSKQRRPLRKVFIDSPSARILPKQRRRRVGNARKWRLERIRTIYKLIHYGLAFCPGVEIRRRGLNYIIRLARQAGK